MAVNFNLLNTISRVAVQNSKKRIEDFFKNFIKSNKKPWMPTVDPEIPFFDNGFDWGSVPVININDSLNMVEETRRYLENRKNLPWFRLAPWENYPNQPYPGQASKWDVDFSMALNQPEKYLEMLSKYGYSKQEQVKDTIKFPIFKIPGWDFYSGGYKLPGFDGSRARKGQYYWNVDSNISRAPFLIDDKRLPVIRPGDNKKSPLLSILFPNKQSDTAYSTWTPAFPSLGINPETGLPYTKEEYERLPDHQKVAIWWSEFLKPTGQISSAYQQTLAKSLAGQGATINQLQNVIGKYSGRLTEAWNLGKEATNMLKQASGKVYNLLGEAENMLKKASSLYLQASNETKPLFKEIYNNLKDVYRQARNMSQNINQNMQNMSETLWQQYMDIYSNIMDAYQRTQTGELSPQTQQWLDLLKTTQEQAIQEALSKYYTEKERRLLDELAGRGIISSKTSASALGDLQEAVAEQLRQAEYQILSDYAKQALELPFKQYESALGLLQAPQVGANLLESARRSQLSALEPLSLAISSLAQQRGTVSDLASTLLSAASGYKSAATDLAAMAPTYLRPAESLLASARTLSSMASEGLGAESGALARQYAMWQQLPDNLANALKIYGGFGMNLLQLLSNMQMNRERIDAAKPKEEDYLSQIIGLLLG